jgi:hypothetical protein
MIKRLILKFPVLLILITLLFLGKAHAYIDPGTTSAVFSSFAYIFAAIATVIGFLFWPIKRAYYFIKEKLSKGEK